MNSNWSHDQSNLLTPGQTSNGILTVDVAIAEELARAANCDNKMIVGREPAAANGRESIGKKGRTFRWSRTSHVA